MFRLDLARLERASEQRLQGEIPSDSSLWEDTNLNFKSPISVALAARSLAEGGVLVEGTFRGIRTEECRRCLDEVDRPFDRPFAFYYVPVTAGEVSDPEARFLPETGVEFDLEPDIREELIFTLSDYVVCRESCKGLCPNCGVDLNSETCDCEASEPDPRWAVLRALLD